MFENSQCKFLVVLDFTSKQNQKDEEFLLKTFLNNTKNIKGLIKLKELKSLSNKKFILTCRKFTGVYLVGVIKKLIKSNNK